MNYREGHNQEIRQKFKPTPRKARQKKAKEETESGDAKQRGMNELEYELQQIITGKHALLK